MHKPLSRLAETEEAIMRRALGLGADSKPLLPPRKRPSPSIRRRIEVALRCVRRDGQVITFYHNENTVSQLQALCEANKKARSFGLRVLWTLQAKITEHARHE